MDLDKELHDITSNVSIKAGNLDKKYPILRIVCEYQNNKNYDSSLIYQSLWDCSFFLIINAIDYNAKLIPIKPMHLYEFSHSFEISLLFHNFGDLNDFYCEFFQDDTDLPGTELGPDGFPIINDF